MLKSGKSQVAFGFGMMQMSAFLILIAIIIPGTSTYLLAVGISGIAMFLVSQILILAGAMSWHRSLRGWTGERRW